MNTGTGEIVILNDRMRRAAFQIRADQAMKARGFTPTSAPGTPIANPDALAAEMLARHEMGPLVELRNPPVANCPSCRGAGHTGRGPDGRFQPCICCRM
jgi:hypothetical protein